MLINERIRDRFYKYAKFDSYNIPYTSKEMINNVINCLSAGKYPVYRYELKFIKGSEKQTLVEVTIPDSPRLENLLLCIHDFGTYGNIALRVCKDKYNSRDPFQKDDKLNAYNINLRYTRTGPEGNVKVIEPFNHIKVSQLQCTITKEPSVIDYSYKMDWLIIIPGVYPEPPEPEACYFHDNTYGPVGYEIPDDMNEWINNEKEE